MINVFLCDDIYDVLDFFSSVIEQAEDMKIVGTAVSEQEAVDGVLRTNPDIVLMDIQMDTETAGISAVKKIYDEKPDIKIIMLTVHENEDLIINSYLAGAVDYIDKLSKPQYILDEIRKIYNKEVLIGPTIAKHIRDEVDRTKKMQASLMYIITKWSMLTRTEVDIVKRLSQGKTRREIAKEKNVEVDTVKNQITNILKKVEYPNTNKLIEDLNRLGIIEYLFKNVEK